MARFQPGQSGNPAGRPKGAKNKNQPIREWIEEVIQENKDQLKKDLMKLDPEARWNAIQKIMNFVVPRIQAASVEVKLEQLSDEQLSAVTESILSKIEQ